MSNQERIASAIETLRDAVETARTTSESDSYTTGYLTAAIESALRDLERVEGTPS